MATNSRTKSLTTTDTNVATVMDVYDIAHDIGQECDRIIDRYGVDTLTRLMPKIVAALEHLEALAMRTERNESVQHELHTRIAQLENDKLEKAEYRLKFEKDLETIEDQWRTDTGDLVALVARLQDDNRRLTHSLQQYSSGSHEVSPTTPPPTTTKNDDHAPHSLLVSNLRATVHRQRVELASAHAEIERLRQQVAHIAHETPVDRQRYCGRPHEQNEVLSNEYFTALDVGDVLRERNQLKARLNDALDELAVFRAPSTDGDTCQNCHKLSNLTFSTVVPRVAPEMNNHDDADAEDAPVQGPIPFEPDDAPWKKHQPQSSIIRKFFRRLLLHTEGSNGGGGGATGGTTKHLLSFDLSKLMLTATAAASQSNGGELFPL